jgi:uncharacterized protein (TIGR03086 family)
MSDVITNHRKACRGFTAIVAEGEGRWANPSPCSEWDARGVVEHVIGFHDDMLLRPTGTELTLPTDDPSARWAATVAAIDAAMEIASPEVSLDQLLPGFTAEMLTHSWDLAMAVGVDPHLDTELCKVSLEFMRANEDKVRASGSFGAAVSRPNNTDAATQLVAFLGRDPGWTP